MGGARFFCIAAALWIAPGLAWAGDSSSSANCLRAADADARLDSVPDCLRTGRHVRVDNSVSRGAATLHSPGASSNTLRSDAPPGALPTSSRVHVSPVMPGIVRSGLFGR